MGIRHTGKVPVHWNYLLAIERDLEIVSRYVEFEEPNYKCYSVEIARIILASGAETDVVCNQLCRLINPNSKAGKIHAYQREILAKIPTIPDFTIHLPRYGITLRPWSNWKRAQEGVPLWWTAYNKIKHARHLNYEMANLKNAINSVAGLFVMVLHLYRAKEEAMGLLSPILLRTQYDHISPDGMVSYPF